MEALARLSVWPPLKLKLLVIAAPPLALMLPEPPRVVPERVSRPPRLRVPAPLRVPLEKAPPPVVVVLPLKVAEPPEIPNVTLAPVIGPVNVVVPLLTLILPGPFKTDVSLNP